jgi:parallel beta-helix repeat protein
MNLSIRLQFGLCLALAAGAAQAQVERCVRTVPELVSAWALGEDDPVVIRLATGVYDLAGTLFEPDAPDAVEVDDDVTVLGGYNSTCTSRVEDPGATVITHGSGGDLLFETRDGYSAGNFVLDRLTIRGAGTVRVNLETPISNDAEFVMRRVWLDQMERLVVGRGAEVRVEQSVVSRSGSCALWIASSVVNTGVFAADFERAWITQGTFVSNAGPALCVGRLDRAEEDWRLDIASSVFWDNGSVDIQLNNPDVQTIDAVLRNNTYTAIQSNRNLRTAPVASSSANPQFINAAAGNWRLAGGSPAINSGRINSNLVIQRDFDGGPRWFGEAPDRGAFESNVGSTATVLTVTNTNDAGIGSLRQALIDANATPNLNEIRFNISGACPRTITLASLLPDIVHPVRIDGYSQPGASRNTAVLGWNANLCIVLNGANQLTGAYGFNVNTGASPDATVSIEGIAFSGHSFAAAQFIAGRDHRFVGNQIGGVVGSTSLIASGTGVRIGGSVEGVRVGGPEPGDRNVIANTLGIGVNLSGSGSTQPLSAVVENNYIGTQSGGDVRGGERGVFIAGPDHLIRGNVIANASSHGVELSGSLALRNRITGNRIGVPALCSGNCVSRGNGGHVVFLRNSAHDNRIESNLIAHSGLDGIAVTGARRNSLRRNTMYEQSGIGIDLGDDGRNLFDANNSVAAPIAAGNDSQNAPSLSSVAGTATIGLAAGALTSANGWYRIDFYGIPSTTGCTLAFAPGPSPAGFFGEGRDWLGSTFLQISNGTNTSDGSASFSEVELQREGSSSYFVAGSTWINATATRLSGPPLTGAYSHRGTSEFGRCRQYVAGSLGGPIFANGFEGP